MELFTFIGTEGFYFFFFPAIYWCIDSTLGLRLGIVLFTTSSLNGLLKLAFHLPRPYWVDQNVKIYSTEPSFGFPSGHSQKAASFWGMLGYSQKRLIITIICIFMILMISLSRLYLGVHYLIDVLGALFFGFLVLWLVTLVEKPVCKWVNKTNPWVIFLSAVVLALIILSLGILFQSFLLDWEIPDSWIALSSRTGKTINPVSLDDLFSYVGLWTGFITGVCFLLSQEIKLGKYQVAGTPNQKIARFFIGITGLIIIYSGLGVVFPQTETVTGLTLRLLRFGLMGAWISGLAPWVFIRLGLSTPKKPLDVESSKSKK